jgi:hypothetical protein
MWMSYAIGYCVICWLIGFLATRTDWWTELMRSLEGKASRLRLTLIEWGVVAFAPLYMPLLVIGVARCVLNAIREQRILRKSSRTFRAYEFVPVNFLHLEEEIREQFELHTPPLVQLNFDLIGDYRLKPEPVPVHDRFFLSLDGKTLASICALLGTSGVSFISILEDGTSVCTTSSEDPHPERDIEPADQIWTSYLPDVPVQDRLAHHLKSLQELCASNGTSVMHFRKEQFREIVTYDQRVRCRWRFRHGGLDSEPPAADFSSLRATPAAPSDCPEPITGALQKA